MSQLVWGSTACQPVLELGADEVDGFQEPSTGENSSLQIFRDAPQRAHTQRKTGQFQYAGHASICRSNARRVESYLLQHGAYEVGGLQQLQVDVHVEGHLAPPFQLLLLWRFVLVPAVHWALSNRCSRYEAHTTSSSSCS